MWFFIGFLAFIHLIMFTATAAIDDGISEYEQSGDFPSEDLINQFTMSLMKTKPPPPVAIPQQHHHDKLQFQSNLLKDIQDFIDLIPVPDVRAKIQEFYRNDRDVQQIYDYVNGKEFLSIKKKLLDVREVREFLNYLNGIGLNIKEILHRVDGLMGISKLKPPSNRNTSTSTFSFFFFDHFFDVF